MLFHAILIMQIIEKRNSNFFKEQVALFYVIVLRVFFSSATGNNEFRRLRGSTLPPLTYYFATCGSTFVNFLFLHHHHTGEQPEDEIGIKSKKKGTSNGDIS